MAERYRVRAIVFDLDGVLVDSMQAIWAYWTDWVSEQADAIINSLGALPLTVIQNGMPTEVVVSLERA